MVKQRKDMWTDEETDMLRRLYEEGVPRKEMSERIGRSQKAVTAQITRLRLAPIESKQERPKVRYVKPRGEVTEDPMTKRVMALMHEGYPPSQIDRILKMPVNTARKIVRLHWKATKEGAK